MSNTLIYLKNYKFIFYLPRQCDKVIYTVSFGKNHIYLNLGVFKTIIYFYFYKNELTIFNFILKTHLNYPLFKLNIDNIKSNMVVKLK